MIIKIIPFMRIESIFLTKNYNFHKNSICFEYFLGLAGRRKSDPGKKINTAAVFKFLNVFIALKDHCFYNLLHVCSLQLVLLPYIPLKWLPGILTMFMSVIDEVFLAKLASLAQKTRQSAVFSFVNVFIALKVNLFSIYIYSIGV